VPGIAVGQGIYMAILKILSENPKYTLMRGVARFSAVRKSVAGMKGLLGNAKSRRYQAQMEARMPTTMFPGVDPQAFLAEMRRRGCAFGLTLPPAILDSVLAYANSHPVFAFRDERCGFLPHDRGRAEARLGKEILLAQYYNCQRDCAAINQLASDPLLNWIALNYLGSIPRFLGCNLWWTYPVRPNRDDQLKHAHFFHRDIDDFRFMKYFFYLTNVERGDGGHWIVSGSHRNSPHIRLKDYVLTRRFDDKEISSFYAPQDILEVVGPEGLGFAEDTLCVHKAASPTRMPRLILQLQFALFDLGVGSDDREPSALQMMDLGGLQAAAV
jgi:hypothetical protein